jgi:Cu2+-exporting ATPase
MPSRDQAILTSDISSDPLSLGAQLDDVLPHPLDDPQEWPSFGVLQGATWVSQLVVDGMHCAACAQTVETALHSLPGVQARVSAAAQRVQITWDPRLSQPSQWLRVLQPLGYRLRPALDASVRDQRKRESRRMLWRWLVACVAMMQVMMYAWPEYIATDLSDESAHLLRWASWVLTLPVMLFSAGPFFSAAWRDVRHRQVSMDLPVALGIAITFIVSTLATFNPDGLLGRAVYFDSLTMFVFFLLTGRWLELRLRDQTAGALDALLNRVPQRVARRRDDQTFEQVALRQLRVGDVLRVHSGEAFAADGVLLNGRTWVDEAILTGESTPLAREVGQQVLAGSHNLGNTVLMCVTGLGADTRYAGIVKLMEQAAASKPHLALLVDRIAQPFLWFVLLAAASAAAWWWPTDPGHALMVAAAVLIVTCPCALSLATPVAMLTAAGHLAKHGVLVQNLPALEALAEVDTVIFDKTGTLSEDRLRIQGIRVRTGITEHMALQQAASLAQYSLHPVSRALVAYAQQKGYTLNTADAVQEQAGMGLTGVCQGHVLHLGRATWCGVSTEQISSSDNAHAAQVHLSDEQGWLASFAWGEALRPEALHTVQTLQAAGLEVRMLSGDSAAAVARVAQALGLVHARGDCSPQDKLAAMQALQAQGRRVAMVGDGLNDGPVLARAHVAIALGQGLAVTHTRADLVVMGDLQSVANALKLSRFTRRVVRQNLLWAMAYNLACVPLALLGYLPAWLAGLGMATSSLGVVLNAWRLRSRTSSGAKPSSLQKVV